MHKPLEFPFNIDDDCSQVELTDAILSAVHSLFKGVSCSCFVYISYEGISLLISKHPPIRFVYQIKTP